MARRSSGYGYNMYDDMYEKMTSGIQTGLGIANAIKQNKVHDEQLKDIETQRREFELDAPVRASTRKTTIAENDTRFTNARNTVTSAYAGVMSDLSSKALESTEPIEKVADTFSNAFGNISDGKLSLLRKPADATNPNAGYTFDIQLNGKTINSFNAVDAKQLAAGVTATRLKHGFLTPQERTAMDREAMIQAETKNVFAAIDPSLHGGMTYDQAMATPKMRAIIYDIVRTNQGTHDFYDKREDQKMNVAAHKSQMANAALQRQLTQQHIDFGQEDQAQKRAGWAYTEAYTKPTQRQLDALQITAAQHAANGNAVQEIEAVEKILPSVIPSLQPVLISGGSNEMDELGVMSNTKPVYGFTSEQQTYKAALLSIYNTLPKNTPVADKIAYADKVVRERNLQRQLEMEQRQADLENADEQAAKQRKAHEQLGKLNKKASPGWGVNPPRKDDENYDPYFYPHSSYLMP